MKRRNVVRRLLAVILSVVLVSTMLPMMGVGGTAKADFAQDKTVAGLSTSAIKAPKAPSSANDAWTGSYVWYGKYDGTPVKYRVLAPKTTIYGGSTMLLDCDSMLYYARFDADGVANSGAQNPNEWKYSDVRSGLNGDAFLTKTNGFTTIEKNAIAKSTIVSHTLVGGTEAGQVSSWTKDVYVNYVALSGEKIFLLDGEDVSNSLYGYYYDDNSVTGKVKEKSSDSLYLWWLRSERDGRADRAGCVNAGGALDSHSVNTDGGVSPAFNINLSSVIFSSVVAGYAGEDGAEYKLTLADSNLNVGITGGQNGTVSGNKMTIPYTVSGADASKTTRVSVLILDKEYKDGNTNGALILYYGNLGVLSLSGTCSFTFPAGFDMSGWGSSYYVYILAEIENGKHSTDYASVPVKLTKSGSIVTSLTIATQPVSTTAYVGDKATFSVAATGTGSLTYQWQFRKNSSAAWANSAQSGNTTATLKVSTTASLHGYQFRCIVKDSYGNQAISQAATLTMKPKITTQPVDKNLLVGSTAKFTVAATGKATLSYQWQYRKNESASWANSGQQGAKTDTLLVSTTAGLHGYQFRCVVTDGNGQKTYSKTVTLTLKPRITTQPVDKSLLVGSTAKFAVAATGKATLTYQWQYRKNETSDWANSGQTGAKTDTLLVSTTAALHGYQFRCIVTDGNGQQSFSSTVTLTLKPRITTQPSDRSVTAGSTAKFTVAATGKATLTYQWQYRKNASSEWANSGQSGNKTATLSVAATAGLNGYQFRCIVTDGNGQKSYTNPVTLSVSQNIPKITKQPESTCVSLGTTASFTVAATGAGTLTYQWQYMSPTMTSWANSAQSGNKTAKLSVATKGSLQGYQFRCVITDGSNRKAYTNAVTLTLCDIPINETYFPDAVFRQYVTENFDTVKDGKLSKTEIQQVNQIVMQYTSISNMKGVEFFTELTFLSCWKSKQLTSLDVSRNTALQRIDCGSCNLNALDVSKNTALTELDCYDNLLTVLDVSKNTELISLRCTWNLMTSLDVSNHTALTSLHCMSSKLTSLNVSGCTALEEIDCRDNKLTSLDVSTCKALKKIIVTTEFNVIGAGSNVNIYNPYN